jgi:hypothetical protein
LGSLPASFNSQEISLTSFQQRERKSSRIFSRIMKNASTTLAWHDSLVTLITVHSSLDRGAAAFEVADACHIPVKNTKHLIRLLVTSF